MVECSGRYLFGIFVVEVQKSLTEGLAHLLVILYGEVSVRSVAEGGASKRRLQSVAVRYAHHPHYHSAGTFLVLLDFEFATLERKLQTKNDYSPKNNPSYRFFLAHCEYWSNMADGIFKANRIRLKLITIINKTSCI